MYECNAIIESADIRIERGFALSAWVFLNYEGAGQGFGGFVLGGTDGSAAGEHAKQPNIAAEFIVRVMQAASVDEWSKLPGKTLRVRKADAFGDIIEIGHIVRGDRWFNPKTAFERLGVNNASK